MKKTKIVILGNLINTKYIYSISPIYGIETNLYFDIHFLNKKELRISIGKDIFDMDWNWGETYFYNKPLYLERIEMIKKEAERIRNLVIEYLPDSSEFDTIEIQKIKL